MDRQYQDPCLHFLLVFDSNDTFPLSFIAIISIQRTVADYSEYFPTDLSSTVDNLSIDQFTLLTYFLPCAFISNQIPVVFNA